MPSLLWMPEDEYRDWNAVRFKKAADAMAFPALAKRKASLYDQGVVSTELPLPEEPPVNPPPAAPSPLGYTVAGDIPSESPIGATLPQLTLPAPPMPVSSSGSLPGFLPQPETPPQFQPSVPTQGPRFGTSALGVSPERESIGSAVQGVGKWNLEQNARINQAMLGFGQDVGATVEAGLTFPGAGAIGGIGLAGIARPLAGLAEREGSRLGQGVVRAIDAVIDFPKLEDIIQESAKKARSLNVSNVFRMGKNQEGKIMPRGVDDLDPVLDAVKRQQAHIDTTAEAMATAIQAKWEQMGKPFTVVDGIVQNGPGRGQAFQDVMSWSRADLDALEPAQSSFVNYFHNLQDSLVRNLEARGVKIAKLDLADGRQYLHRVYLQVNDARNAIGARRAVGATQSYEMHRTHETVQELLDAGKIETLDNPSTLFYTYAQELLKKAADSDLLRYLKPLGQSVRERVGEEVIQAAGEAGRLKVAAGHLLGVVKQVSAGASPAGASLRAIRQNFPEIGDQLDRALLIRNPEVDTILTRVGKEMWDNLATTPQRFREALNQVTGSALGRIPKQVSYSDIMDTLGLLQADQKTADEMITQIYRNAFQMNTRQRAEALKDVLISAQENQRTLGESFNTAKRTFNQKLHAASELYGTEGKVTSMPGLRKGGASAITFAGKKSQQLTQIIFPEEVVLPGGGTITGKDLADRLTKELGPQGTSWYDAYMFGPAKALNAVIKAGQVVFDLSGPLVQGFPVLLSNPARWARAAAKSYETFINPEARTMWLAQPENYQNMKGYVEAGGKLGSSDFTEALQRGGVLEKAGEALGKYIPLHPGKAFTTFSDVVRIETFGALKDVAARGGATEVVDFAAKLTGGRSMYGPITHPNQRTLQQLVAYAADYTRASLALAVDAFKPGIEGDLARPALVKMAVRYPALVYLAAMGVDAVNGEKRFSNPDSEDFILNINGPYFMRVPIGGDVMSFSGIWPSLMRTSVKATAQTVAGRPDRFVQAWQDFAWSRKSPLGGVITAQVQGQTFAGKPLETPGARAGELGKSVLPFWAQGVIEGQGPAAIAAQFMGAGSSQASPSMLRNELLDKYAKAAGGVPWQELSLPEQSALRKKYPDIIQAQDVARTRQATTGRDEWKTYAEFNSSIATRREEIRNEIADLTQQFKDKGISGQQYRDAIQQREFEIGRLGRTMQSDPTGRFKEMPVTPEEYTAFQKKMDLKEPVKTAERTATDGAIQAYYAISNDFADKNGFIADMSGFMRKREQFLSSLPASLRQTVDEYLSRNKDPELVAAQKTMSEYQAIPRFILPMPPEEEADVSDALDRIRAREGMLPPGVPSRQAIGLMQELQRAKTPGDRAAVTKAMIILKDSRLYNPQRRLFWAQHPLLQKYYSDVQLAD